MTDRKVLPFPSNDDHQVDMLARFGALYATTPMPEPSQAERCTRAVLTAAMHRRSRSARGMPSVRWWWGAAAAAALVIATTRNWPNGYGGSVADSAVAVAGGNVAVEGTVTPLGGNAVRFDLVLVSAAKEVAIVGDFNGWDENATPMAKHDGAWSAKIPLGPGRHVYAFVVDGERWVVDPLAPQVPNDGFGPTNAVVIDGGPK